MARENKTRFALLGILSLGAASGYDIKKMMEQSTNHFWREGDNSIYPILKQLLHEKSIHCKIENQESNKPKKIYTLTTKGHNELQDWLMEDNVQISHRNELLLKVFFGWNVQTEVIINLIEKFKDHVKTKLKTYTSIAAGMQAKKLTQAELYPYLTLQAGINSAEAALKWCAEAVRVLKNDKHEFC